MASRVPGRLRGRAGRGAARARRQRDGLAFATWSAFSALLLASVAFGLYPWVLPSSIDPAYTLTLDQAHAADRTLRIGAVWRPIGIALALTYTVFVHRRFSERIAPGGWGSRSRRAARPRTEPSLRELR